MERKDTISKTHNAPMRGSASDLMSYPFSLFFFLTFYWFWWPLLETSLTGNRAKRETVICRKRPQVGIKPRTAATGQRASVHWWFTHSSELNDSPRPSIYMVQPQFLGDKLKMISRYPTGCKT